MESPDKQAVRSSQYQVICVCAACGFPFSGNAKRITNVGNALQEAGIGFRVLHCGPSPAPLDTRRSGVYRGIRFEYTTSLRRPANLFLRLPVYFRALAGLTLRLSRLGPARKKTAVYLFVMEGPLVLYTGLLCRLLRIPLVQEMNEWFPACRDSKILHWLYRKPIFSMATGLLAISKSIQARVQEAAKTANPRLLIHYLPLIVDSERFSAAPGIEAREPLPVFLWCGIGYTRDLRFLIRVLGRVHRLGYRCRLRVITAAYLEWGPPAMLEYAEKQGLPPQAIDITGCVDDRALETYYKTATAHLLPLWDDEQSRMRMPNKLAEYLASGRPVITGGIGDLLNFLSDGVNAYIGKPGSEEDFVSNMISVLRDPARAAVIGAAGQTTCLQRLDYRFQVESLSRFFIQCIDCRNSETAAVSERPRDAEAVVHPPAGEN